MAAVLAVFGVVDTSEPAPGALAQVPGLPALQAVVAIGAEPRRRLVVVLGEGPVQVLHFDELAGKSLSG